TEPASEDERSGAKFGGVGARMAKGIPSLAQLHQPKRWWQSELLIFAGLSARALFQRHARPASLTSYFHVGVGPDLNFDTDDKTTQQPLLFLCRLAFADLQPGFNQERSRTTLRLVPKTWAERTDRAKPHGRPKPHVGAKELGELCRRGHASEKNI